MNQIEAKENKEIVRMVGVKEVKDIKDFPQKRVIAILIINHSESDDWIL